MLSMTEPAVTTAEAAAYIDAGGYTGWPDSQAAQMLMRGQRYLAMRYNSRWLVGWEPGQAPDAVRYAIIEAAMVEAQKPGILSPVSTPGTDKVLVQAGKLAWERIGDASGADSYIPRIAAVEGLLVGLVRAPISGLFLRAIGA